MIDRDGKISEAIGGDRIALQQLLLEHTSTVRRYIATRIPTSIQGLIDADDIVQQACVEAFRSIHAFQPQSDEAFSGWFKAIALHRLQDAVKSHKRIMRGGKFRRADRLSSNPSQSLVNLVELLSAGSHTPSRSVARHEALQLVRQSIENLPDDYRQAVTLRLLEGRSLEETAEAMQRTPRAIQGLIDRAKKKSEQHWEACLFTSRCQHGTP